MAGKKKKGILSRNKGMIAIVVVSFILGFLMGPLSNGVLKGFFDKFVRDDNFLLEILNLAIILFIFLIGYIIHVLIHELGHLIFGLLSGYKFVSFRVGSFTIIREEGEFKVKRFNIPGTGGQCLMMPPEKKDGKFPFVIFNMGGVLLNLIVALLTLLIAFSMEELSWVKVILVLVSAGGIFAAITNGIPLRIGGITNDAHNVLTMLKDKDSRDSFYLQLRVNGLLTQGVRLKDMNYDEFILEEDIDYENPLNFARVFINHNYHLDNMDFNKANEALDFAYDYLENTIAVYRMEWASEKLFLEIIDGCGSRRIENLYDKNLQKYIDSSKFMLNKKRIMMAYEYIYKGNVDEGLKYYKELKELAEKFPIKGEVDMEIMLAEHIKGMRQ